MTTQTNDGRWLETREAMASAYLGKSRIIFRRFWRNRPAAGGTLVFLLITLIACLGPHFQKWSTTDIDPMAIADAPSPEHWLGTTQSGRDLFALVLEGTRTSIMIGIFVGLGATCIAVLYGCSMAYFGGKAETLLLFLLESAIMVPTILLIAVVTSGNDALQHGIPGWVVLVLVMLAFSWMGGARLVRALAKVIMHGDFVVAARFMGVKAWRIVCRHLVPNIGSLLVLDVTRGVTAAILAEVGFSFVGVGVKDPDVSLGVLLSHGTQQASSYPWIFWCPLVVMIVVTGSLSVLNDGLRDAFDPGSASSGFVKRQQNTKKGWKG